MYTLFPHIKQNGAHKKKNGADIFQLVHSDYKHHTCTLPHLRTSLLTQMAHSSLQAHSAQHPPSLQYVSPLTDRTCSNHWKKICMLSMSFILLFTSKADFLAPLSKALICTNVHCTQQVMLTSGNWIDILSYVEAIVADMATEPHQGTSTCYPYSTEPHQGTPTCYPYSMQISMCI